jgi:signal transduction histidine kinase
MLCRHYERQEGTRSNCRSLCLGSSAADLPQINAVADQVKQVLLDLLIMLLMPAKDGGGTITISMAIDDGGYVKIAVRDSGQRNLPEIMPRILEPFLVPETKGTGLGLSVSHDTLTFTKT